MMKGAADVLCDYCTHYMTKDGQEAEITDSMRTELKSIQDVMAKKALRNVVWAFRDVKEGQCGERHDEFSSDHPHLYELEEVRDGQKGFTLIAICGIMDIIRDTVPDAVESCKQAGVRVRMVTGDSIVTAIAIAKMCGILDPDWQETPDQKTCMTGKEFDKFVGGLVHTKTGERITVQGKDPKVEKIANEKNMDIIRKNLKVLARSSPQDKYTLVAGLSNMGDIVAVTGDGTNDAPALKRASVGFAMNTGTQVAHAAAAIMIMDDDFASIVKACSWGRNVYDNIRRFLQFQLTVNVAALVIAFVGGVIMAEAPLTAIQFLWVNMIMDTLAALALATEDPKPELLQRAPYRKGEYIISVTMAKHILGQTFFQIGILFAFVFGASKFVPEYWDDSYPEQDGTPVLTLFDKNHDYWTKVGIDPEVL